MSYKFWYMTFQTLNFSRLVFRSALYLNVKLKRDKFHKLCGKVCFTDDGRTQVIQESKEIQLMREDSTAEQIFQMRDYIWSNRGTAAWYPLRQSEVPI